MTNKELTNHGTDEDRLIINQMERIANSYDTYMKRITFGRENTLREMTLNLAGIKPGDWILEIGC